MKSVKDKFSYQAKIYKKYRPIYPKEIYHELNQLVKRNKQCWDCGTGNGQVAIQLASYFDKVYATDISQNQLDNAKKNDKVTYKVERAERTNFLNNQFDLITVAQAAHWFDFQEFTKEVNRVGVNGGIISIWGYGLLRVNPYVDKLIDKFYYDSIGSYWNKERSHIDNAYESIEFDFKEIKITKKMSIIANWTLAHLEGYFNSWSSIQNFNKLNPKINPVNQIIQEIKKYWKEDEIKKVKFPIFMKIGEIEK